MSDPEAYMLQVKLYVSVGQESFSDSPKWSRQKTRTFAVGTDNRNITTGLTKLHIAGMVADARASGFQDVRLTFKRLADIPYEER